MNAPRKLAELLESWSKVGGGGSIMKLHGGGDLAAWRLHVEAMDLVGQINRILMAMEESGRDTAHYRRSEAEWVKGIIVPEHSWGQSHTNGLRVIQQTTIDQLRALADVVDGSADGYQLEEAGRVQSLGALDELLALIDDPQALTLTLHERRYVFELVSALRVALTESATFSAIDLLRRINELVGYLTELADRVDDHGRTDVSSRLRDIARKVRPVAFRSAVVAAAAIQTAAAAKELLP